MGIEGELFNTLMAPTIGEEASSAETSDKQKAGKKVIVANTCLHHSTVLINMVTVET
jgi:hypothetical protein